MELPVQFINKFNIPEEFEYFPRDVVAVPTTNTTTIVPRTLEEEVVADTLLKQWFTTVELERELFHEAILKRLIVKVDPILRVAILKIEDLVTPFKRVIRLPEHVNIQLIKVEVDLLKKVLHITAPFMNTTDAYPRTFALEQAQQQQQQYPEVILREEQETMEQLEKLRELTLMQVREVEPTLYMVMTEMINHLPKFIVPRCYRELETGYLRVILDVTKTELFRPEELIVKVNKVERTLMIRLFKKEMIPTTTTFLPRQLVHEFILPTFFNIQKIKLLRVNEKLMRIELPILTRVPKL